MAGKVSSVCKVTQVSRENCEKRARNMDETYMIVIGVLNVVVDINYIAWAARWYTCFLCDAI